MDYGIIKRYSVKDGHCQIFTLSETCLPDKYQNRSRFIYRSPHQDTIDEVRIRQNRDEFKNKLKEQQWKIEELFTEAKENYCLRRAKYFLGYPFITA